ncbi:MAG: DUF3108 domain-containing protein [Candidatus Korobacteraceae bacterium]|jgi:hypothetical protein
MRHIAQALIFVFALMCPLLPAQEKQRAEAAAPASAIQPVAPGYRFPNGLAFNYDAEWRLLKVGTATVRLDPAGNEERVTASGDSTGVVAMLFRVQDRFESFFDHRTFCSRVITKHSEEGLHKRHTIIHFDQARRKSLLDETNLRTGQQKHTEQDIPGCVTDVLSGMFYLASLPLQPGNTYHFPLNDGGQTVNVHATVEAREDITTPAGTFHTVRVQPSPDLNVLRNRGNVWLWYTDDANHTLVQMKTRLFWGTLSIQLVRTDYPASPATAGATTATGAKPE